MPYAVATSWAPPLLATSIEDAAVEEFRVRLSLAPKEVSQVLSHLNSAKHRSMLPCAVDIPGLPQESGSWRCSILENMCREMSSPSHGLLRPRSSIAS